MKLRLLTHIKRKPKNTVRCHLTKENMANSCMEVPSMTGAVMQGAVGLERSPGQGGAHEDLRGWW